MMKLTFKDFLFSCVTDGNNLVDDENLFLPVFLSVFFSLSLCLMAAFLPYLVFISNRAYVFSDSLCEGTIHLNNNNIVQQ